MNEPDKTFRQTVRHIQTVTLSQSQEPVRHPKQNCTTLEDPSDVDCPSHSLSMLPPTCLACSFSSRPFPKRRGGLASCLLLSSALRSNSNSNSPSFHRLPPSQKPEAALPAAEQDDILELLYVWGFTKEEMHQCPAAYLLLSRDPSHATVLFTTLLSLGFSQKSIKSMLLEYPRLLKIRAESVLLMAAYFTVKLEMDQSRFIQLIVKRPKMLNLKLNERVIPICDYLIEDLGLEKAHISKMLLRFPQMLVCSVEMKLKPVVRFFTLEIGIPKETFAKRLKHQPTILGLSLELLRGRVEWLKCELHYEDDDIRHICSLTVNLFQQREVTLTTKIDYICQKFDLDRRQCGQMLKHYPQVLCISIQNMEQTVDYITREMGRHIQELIKSPRVLWISVEERMRPRFERLRELNIPHLDYSLVTLYGSKDDAFQRLLERQLDDSIGDL